MFRILVFASLLLSAVPVAAGPLAWLVMDARTGQELLSENADATLDPGSLVKLMTLLVTADALASGEVGWDDPVTVSANAASQPPSRLGLRAGEIRPLVDLVDAVVLRSANDAAQALAEYVGPGEIRPLVDLVDAVVLRSANDAAQALAEYVGPGEAAFLDRMTRRAAAMCLARTVFTNVAGRYPAPGMPQTTSARDIAVTAWHVLHTEPALRDRLAPAGIRPEGMVLSSGLIDRTAARIDGMDGLMTAYSAPGGYNIAATAERDGVRVIVAVLGADSGDQRMHLVDRLMDDGFALAPAQVRPALPSLGGCGMAALAAPRDPEG